MFVLSRNQFLSFLIRFQFEESRRAHESDSYFNQSNFVVGVMEKNHIQILNLGKFYF